MDHSASRRGMEVGRKRQNPPFVVIVIGEVFNASSHPLFPVAPAEELPFALLPVCNTPVIDYILRISREMEQMRFIFYSIASLWRQCVNICRATVPPAAGRECRGAT
ncbi:putative guanine-nucleotide-exchange-factor [Trypanosoma cruzi]|uniref:Putative guanine-nucleotide-exchange-factor n=1 Tax=Trypanosoma cruzi TaxID=5693 RepID=A0A2V2VWX6_TRYCR|nr:putative guanine-nucleotide-exchange-factor [Trypanosoma cruzi]